MPIKINVKYLTFVTRPFVFTCNFDLLIQKLSDKSVPFFTTYSPALTDDFIKQFLNPKNLTLQRKIYRFKERSNDDSVNVANKHEHVLFLLNKNSFLNDSNVKHFTRVHSLFLEVLQFSKDNCRNLSYKLGLKRTDFSRFLDSLEERTKGIRDNSFEKLKTIVIDFSNRIKNLKNEFFKAEEKSNLYIDYSNTLKKTHKIIDTIDAILLLNKKTQIFALASQAGTLQISIVYEKSIDVSINSNMPLMHNKSLIEKACWVSGIISSIVNRLPKIFSILNLNKYLDFGDEISIFDNSTSLLFDSHYLNDCDMEDLSNKVPTQKSLYLRMVVDQNHSMTRKNVPMDFFNYLSLLVAFHHSYDENSLLEYCAIVSSNKYKAIDEKYFKLCDRLNKPTEHLYIDDSLAVLSAIDETVNVDKINQRLPPSARKNPMKYAISHQLRIYSMWDYVYVCNAQAFGSSAMMVNILLSDYIKKKISYVRFKALIHIKQAFLSRVMSRLDSEYNHTVFSVKQDSFKITEHVFEEMGLIRLQEQTNNSFNINWESANLMSSQNYNRYSLLLTIVGLSITIASYGLIAKVAISCTPDCYGQLMVDLLTNSPKILVILTVISVPIFIYLVLFIIELIKSFVSSKNIAKLDGFKSKKIKK